jgi:hypothetical protein
MADFKVEKYRKEIIDLWNNNTTISKSKAKIAHYLKIKYDLPNNVESIRKQVGQFITFYLTTITDSDSSPQETENTASPDLVEQILGPQSETKFTSGTKSTLTEDEFSLLTKYREQKSLLEKECALAGIDIREVKHYWYKSKLFSIFAKPKEKSLDDLKQHLIKDLTDYSPVYPIIKRARLTDSHCLVVDPADIHIGKLASEYETKDSYNSNIAIQRVHTGLDKLLQNVQPFNIDKVGLIIGNDILHTDNTKSSTTSGTHQDSDGMWFDNFLLAKQLYVDVIEKLVQVADVHVMHNPSNHDYMAGWYLAQVIQTWFKNNKNVTFDVSIAHRKAFAYHSNLIGTTHGDGAKNSDLPLLMAQEFKKEWAETSHRYLYTHHVHHKQSKDYVGITVESSRSVSGTDSWHSKAGYQHAPKAIEAYLHHPEYGQVARLTHKF